MNKLIEFLDKNKNILRMYLNDYNLDDSHVIQLVYSYTNYKDFYFDIGFNSNQTKDPYLIAKLAYLFYQSRITLLPSVKRKVVSIYIDENHKENTIKEFLLMLNKKKHNIQNYLIFKQGFSNCDAFYFSDFYEVLEKTNHGQLIELLKKMISEDIKEFRNEILEQKRNARHGISCNPSNVTDDEKAERMMSILIKIFNDCRSYYSYFDLLKNLYCLKDSLKNNTDTIEDIPTVLYKIVTSSKRTFDIAGKDVDLSIPYKNKNNEVLIAVDWFNDDQICDYSELLKMYFDYQRTRKSESLYNDLFPNDKCLITDPENYVHFIATLLDYLSSTYIEHPYWCLYSISLNKICTDAGLKDNFDRIFKDACPKESEKQCEKNESVGS